MIATPKHLLSFILLLFVILTSGFLYSIFAQNNSFLNSLLPPSDYYLPLAESPIQFKTKGSKFTLNFTNKYIGRHALAICTSKKISNSEPFKLNIDIKVTVKKNNKIIYVKRVIQCRSWITMPDGDTAFFVFFYNVPKHLPKNEHLVMEIELLEEAQDIQKKFGATKAIIMKLSDLV